MVLSVTFARKRHLKTICTNRAVCGILIKTKTLGPGAKIFYPAPLIEEVVFLKLLGKLLLFILALGAAVFGLALLAQETGPDYISVYDTDDNKPY